MSFLHLKSALPIFKTAMVYTLLISTMQLMIGCDSQPSSSNNDGTTQKNNTDKDMADNDGNPPKHKTLIK